ncbi:hypothetical protein CPB83DRAFT_941072 [Crepidotus variabilis]|uniref:Uncharacterized protein n=1 Tax=Crepidotus variabilis TaxID=179855 RepID=A0A9P6JMS6_9AGAR|nr:hypothetical protein CPB83DRAFT_941072 [Crepidotus variabilis]
MTTQTADLMLGADDPSSVVREAVTDSLVNLTSASLLGRNLSGGIFYAFLPAQRESAESWLNLCPTEIIGFNGRHPSFERFFQLAKTAFRLPVKVQSTCEDQVDESHHRPRRRFGTSAHTCFTGLRADDSQEAWTDDLLRAQWAALASSCVIMLAKLQKTGGQNGVLSQAVPAYRFLSSYSSS